MKERAGAVSPLSGRDADVLDAAHDLGAVGPESRVTTGEVAGRLGLNLSQLKSPIRSLVGRGLLASHRGRLGGVWLTEHGRSHVTPRGGS